MKKVIIIDDELLAAGLVEEYLESHNDLQVVAKCSNGFEGLKAIQTYQPDLVFLDVQMPKINGFEMLELMDHPLAVIFTTAFDEYAIKAFELNAIDYLLKPFSQERFNQAVQRWKEKPLLTSSQPLQLPSEERHRIVVKSGNAIRIIAADEILYIEAYDDYVKVHIDGDVFLKKQTMQQTEQMLNRSKFIRVHRSYILNLSEINKIEPYGKDSAIAILKNGAQMPLSKAGYSRLKEVLGI